MLSPYAVTCMRLHVSKKSAGGSGAPSMTGRSQMAWKRAWATALHIAGGYSFNTAVFQLPDWSLPIVAGVGISHLTRLAWRHDKSCGRLKRRRWVGLCDFAPISPWKIEAIQWSEVAWWPWWAGASRSKPRGEDLLARLGVLPCLVRQQAPFPGAPKA